MGRHTVSAMHYRVSRLTMSTLTRLIISGTIPTTEQSQALQYTTSLAGSPQQPPIRSVNHDKHHVRWPASIPSPLFLRARLPSCRVSGPSRSEHTWKAANGPIKHQDLQQLGASDIAVPPKPSQTCETTELPATCAWRCYLVSRDALVV